MYRLPSRASEHLAICPGPGAVPQNPQSSRNPLREDELGLCPLCQEPLDDHRRIVVLPCAHTRGCPAERGAVSRLQVHAVHLACLLPQMLEGKYDCPFGCGRYLEPECTPDSAGFSKQ